MRRSPIRSTVVAAVVGAAASGSLSACATFTNTGTVAEVAGSEITTDRFERLSEVYFDRNDAFGTRAPVQGRVDAEASRFLLSAMINQQMFREYLDEQDIDVDAERTDLLENGIATSPLGELDLNDDFLDLVADLDGTLRSAAFAKVTAPDAGRLEAMYDDDPSNVGLTCVRHILVETRGEADDLLDELADGADFATLAEERSTDPTAVGTGGAITGAGGEDEPCIELEAVVRGFDPGFAAGLLEAPVGVPYGPVESSFGWHVILQRPWSEIGDAVVSRYESGDAGKLLFDGDLATADVEVDPRYGTWNGLAGAVEPIG